AWATGARNKSVTKMIEGALRRQGISMPLRTSSSMLRWSDRNSPYGVPGSFATGKKMGDNVEGSEPRRLMSPVIIPGHSEESTTSIEIHGQCGETCHMSHSRPLAPISGEV